MKGKRRLARHRREQETGKLTSEAASDGHPATGGSKGAAANAMAQLLGRGAALGDEAWLRRRTAGDDSPKGVSVARARRRQVGRTRVHVHTAPCHVLQQV